MTEPRSQTRSFAGRWLPRLGMLAVFLTAMELAARMDDYIHQGVSLGANPDSDYDLLQRESWGYRGRSGGRFQKWKLNAFGFRGSEISPVPEPGTTRLLILGASETFGLTESPGSEYPMQLQQILERSGRYEVINGGTAGMSLKTMLDYWENWASRFQPHVVLIYPTPIFYLRDEPPSPPPATASPDDAERQPGFHFRIADRAAGAYRALPISVRNIRRQRIIERELAGRDPAWFFAEPPADRLRMFGDDAGALVRAIRRRGAVPVVITYAMSATSPPRPEDRVDLSSMRYDFLRASPEIIAAFEVRGNEALREVASLEAVPLIDAARELSGRHELFGDLVHFNDAGAAQMARLLADAILQRPVPGVSPPQHGTSPVVGGMQAPPPRADGGSPPRTGTAPSSVIE